MRYGVIGSRDVYGAEYANMGFIKETLDNYTVSKLISGGGRGSEALAAQWAKEKNISLEIIAPDLATNSDTVKAFHIRNSRIIRSCDVLLVFSNGRMGGTEGTISPTLQAVYDALSQKKAVHLIPLR